MDDYFITKKAVEIILANINDHFIKCLINLTIKDRYTNDFKLILGIIELLKTYITTRRNDILSSCIKYTNKSYYLQLTDSLFRIIQSYLESSKQNNRTVKFVFISDLIEKYNNPIISNTPIITRNFNNNNARTRFNTVVDDNDDSIYAGVSCYVNKTDETGEAGEAGDAGDAGDANDDDYRADDDENKDRALISQVPSKDAGTLFRDAYYKLNKSKSNYRSNRDFELKKIDVSNCTKNDLL
jgi:hypothetical protein